MKPLNDSWLTINLLSQAEPAFTAAAIRNLVFQASHGKTEKDRALSQHIRRIGSKVLINHGGFISWINDQNR